MSMYHRRQERKLLRAQLCVQNACPDRKGPGQIAPVRAVPLHHGGWRLGCPGDRVSR
jgi:hypothetical protein